MKSYNRPNNKINGLNYREKLLKKCNSQILINKKIVPISTSNRDYINNNNLNCSIEDKTKNIMPTIKTPASFKKMNLSPIKQLKMPLLSKFLKLNHSFKVNKNIGLNKLNSERTPNIEDLLCSFKSNENKKEDKDIKSISNNNIEDNKKQENDIKSINNNIEENKKEENDINNNNNNNKNNNEDNNKDKDNNVLIISENKENDSFISKNSETIENSSKNLFQKKMSHKLYTPKYSKFYKFSKDRNVSANNIYNHYINEEMNDSHLINDPLKNLTKYLEKKHNNQFNDLYMIDKNSFMRLKEIKDNNSIAYKEDFDVKEYQQVLCGMLKKRIGKMNMCGLKDDYRKLNEIIERRYLSYKGRYSKLADKISNFAPMFLIEKLHKLDEDNLKNKAKLFKINIIKKDVKDETYGFNDFKSYLKKKFIPNIDIKRWYI